MTGSGGGVDMADDQVELNEHTVNVLSKGRRVIHYSFVVIAFRYCIH